MKIPRIRSVRFQIEGIYQKIDISLSAKYCVVSCAIWSLVLNSIWLLLQVLVSLKSKSLVITAVIWATKGNMQIPTINRFEQH